MSKKPPARKPEQHELDEFAEKYETLSAIYQDPMEVVFAVMAKDEVSDETKLQAAGLLMSFRFPKLKALENKNADKGQPLQFNITLNQTPKEVDVTPPTLKLASSK